MSHVAALLKARRAKKAMTATDTPVKKRKAPEPEPSTGTLERDAGDEPSVSSDEDLDVHPEESYRAGDGQELLFDIKRMRAVFSRHGFSKVQPSAMKAVDTHLKQITDEIVARAVLIAACSGRKQPTREDAIKAVQQIGIFRNIVVGV
jgi:histone H3/H4